MPNHMHPRNTPSTANMRILAKLSVDSRARPLIPLAMANRLTPADIENLARSKGMSMAEVCRRAGVAPSTFSRWKLGHTKPMVDSYDRVAAIVEGKQK